MSDTEHYTGKLTPTGKTLSEFAPDAEDIYDRDLYENVVEIEGLIYTVEKSAVCQDGDIFTSSKNSDGTINFEVKYYSGGCGFNEAIEYSLTLAR